MTSGTSDPFNKVISSSFNFNEVIGFEDSLGDQVASDAPDEPMPDSYGNSGVELGTFNAQPTAKFKVEDTDAEFPWSQLFQGTIDLDDSESEMEGGDNKEGTTGGKKAVDCTDGVQDNLPGHQISLLHDNNDDKHTAAVKPEKSEAPYDWAKMDHRTIELSDSEDQTTSTVSIKEEPKNVEFNWADMGKRVIDLSDSDQESKKARGSKLGKSVLQNRSGRGKRNAADLEKMRQFQKMYAEKALKKQGVAGAGAIFKISQALNAKGTEPKEPNLKADGFEWMTTTVIPDDDTDFQALKKAYKAKKKAKTATWEDDVAFKKAQDLETSRIRRLAREAEDSDDTAEENEDEGSEEELFVSQSKSSAKRPFVASIADDLNNASEKRSKTTLPGKRARKNFLEKELRWNWLAGIQPILQRDRKRLNKNTTDTEESDTFQHRSKPTKGNKRPRTMPKPKAPKKKFTATGREKNVNSLLNSNVYQDANANLGQPTVPVVPDKRKQDAVTSIIASAPTAGKKEARSDMEDIVRATKLLGFRKVLPDGKGNWAFQGMRTSLYHYQVQGAARMKERELGPRQPLGGLLCDEMGLGKTVMTIAAMIANRPHKEVENRCTLIVCPPALLTQWEQELEKHVDASVFARVIRYQAGNRIIGKGAVLDLERADVVLTTYQEVARSYPKCDIPKDIKETAAKEAWWTQKWESGRDILHRALFYRVVLDEAHAIKNHKSMTSIACRALMATLRWGCSATPIQNRLEELFPYFKFLRVNHTGSFKDFQGNYCLQGSNECNMRLHARLDQMMIRRTHKDKLLGAPLLLLPKNTVDTIRLKFNEVEKTVYEQVRMRCSRAINYVAKFGTIEERRQLITILFQRLRQMTAHIFMVQEVLEKAYEFADLHEIWRRTVTETAEFDNPEQIMMVAIEKMIAAKEDSENSGPAVATNFGPPPETNEGSGKKAASLPAKFGRILRDLKKNALWSELSDRTLCSKCGNPPEDPMVTSCLHVYCRECLSNLAYEASENDQDQTTCHKCKRIYHACESCEGLKELDVEDLDLASRISEERTRKKPFKLTMEYVDSDDKILLSTKLSAVIAQLNKWLTDDPQRKIIVFSEWHLVFHVLTRVCQQRGWKCCNYNGKMSHKARDKTLHEFRNDAEIKIMIASLKCGGQGLNLTVASKVICVDLWFNSCVEQQAFCRVFRIGQVEETYITRFMVEGTVDATLIQMQEEKKEIISGAMDDREVLAKLSMEDLMRLFGDVAHDSNGKPFILVDDEEDMGRKEKPGPN